MNPNAAVFVGITLTGLLDCILTATAGGMQKNIYPRIPKKMCVIASSTIICGCFNAELTTIYIFCF